MADAAQSTCVLGKPNKRFADYEGGRYSYGVTMERFTRRDGIVQTTFGTEYMELVESQATFSSVTTRPDELFAFLDETGDENLSKGERLFAFSGCVFIGRVDVEELNQKWAELRRSIFKVPADRPYHSSRHLGKVKPTNVQAIADFLSSANVKYVSAQMHHPSRVTAWEPVVDALMKSLESLVNGLFSQHVRRDEWYFEHSYRLTPKLMTSWSPRYNRSQEHGGMYFVRKSSLIPVIEIADLVNSVAGDNIRKKRAGKQPSQPALFECMFADPSKGSVMNTYFA